LNCCTNARFKSQAQQGSEDLWEEALSEFPHAPSPGAAELLAAARNFWTQERVDT
jgi:hypothetical protein